VAAALVLPLLGACTSDHPAPTTPTQGTLQVKDGNRPFTLHVPPSYDPGKAAALVILLHAYSQTGAGQEAYFNLTPQSDKYGFLYAYPDGLVDRVHNHFWNATDACCDAYGSTVDDSTYLSDLIKLLEREYTVDTRRVYLIGHSNGAFMTFRMACDHADQIAAIAALNGAMWQDVSRCRPATAVSVLDIRSSADQTILYDGGRRDNNVYPSAATTDKDWLGFDHCSATPTPAPGLDLDRDLRGAETVVSRYGGCADGSTVETWTIIGGSHNPSFGPNWAPDVIVWLLSQIKPPLA
jgi:polyhydroxybutyrate depolymerase